MSSSLSLLARGLLRSARSLETTHTVARCCSPLHSGSFRTPLLIPRVNLPRSFSTTRIARASLASHPPGQPTELVYSPTPELLRAAETEDGDELDIELVPVEEAQIEMTERAAEQLRAIANREGNPEAALRILVESGGCHGYQYKMELATKRNPDDYHFSHLTVKPSNILVDAVSLSLLKGSVIDFATELIGSSFRVAENPQAKGSGCGCGVSWELKL